MINSKKEIRENDGIECDKEVGSPLTEGLSEVVIMKLEPRTKESSHKDLGEPISIRGSCKDKKDPRQRKAWHVQEMSRRSLWLWVSERGTKYL